jgi:hypothetical protein
MLGLKWPGREADISLLYTAELECVDLYPGFPVCFLSVKIHSAHGQLYLTHFFNFVVYFAFSLRFLFVIFSLEFLFFHVLSLLFLAPLLSLFLVISLYHTP